ncbi:MAG TPA: ester cyclase [Anaerolineales bacterium]|nr:ester cyclase [Anaerolineales bacterium]
MTPEEIKSTLLKGIDDFWHKRDVDEYYRIVDEGFVFHRPPFPSVEGKQANRQADEASLTAFSDIRCTVDEIIVEGETAAAHWTWQARHTGLTPALGIPPTGKLVEFSGCSIYHFRAGRLVETWEFGDYLGLLQQLGVIPAMA